MNMHVNGIRLAVALSLFLAFAGSLHATPTVFTGSYTNNFNNLGTGGTTLPAGFRAMTLPGANSTYTAASPITPAALAGAVVSGTQTLTVWNSGSAVASSSSSLFNCDSVGNINDRALGSDPTGIGAMVVELAMTNLTGTNLPGVIFSCDVKCLVNGTGGSGNESAELPGYSFFYSLTGGSSATEWTKVNALSLGNYTQGTVSNSGLVAITFPSALTNNGIMYFRWADDNCMATSPDQMLAIDNIGISVNSILVPLVTIIAPTNDATFLSGTNILINATASESGGAITNVAFYHNGTKLGDLTDPPFTLTWSNATAGAHTLSVVAADAQGVTGSASVSVTVFDARSFATLRQIQTIFVIAMENHNFTQPSPASSPQQLLGNSAAPYINSLITAGNSNALHVSYATHYYNAGIGVHPSEPSYVWAEAGTDFGSHTDADPSAGSGNLFTVPHLTAQLNAAAIPWRNYQEDLQYVSGPAHTASGTAPVANPYNGSTEYKYAARHNPMVFFTDTQAQSVYPLTNFLAHLTNNLVGRYNWITPNLDNDMHDSISGSFTYHGIAYTGDQSAIAQGDNFLSILIPKIMASAAYQNNGAIIIWWDESEDGDTTSYTIPEIIISPMAKGNAYASMFEYSHSSDVKTIETIFGLSFLQNAIPAGETRAAGSGYNNVATVNDLSDMFVPALVVPHDLSGQFIAGSGFQLTFSVPAQQTYRVLTSADVTDPLANWTQLISGIATSNSVTITDTNVSGVRFYRVASP
jgi:hypothetical protein